MQKATHDQEGGYDGRSLPSTQWTGTFWIIPSCQRAFSTASGWSGNATASVKPNQWLPTGTPCVEENVLLTEITTNQGQWLKTHQ